MHFFVEILEYLLYIVIRVFALFLIIFLGVDTI